MPSSWQELQEPEPGEFIPFPSAQAAHPKRLDAVRAHLLNLAFSETPLASIITMSVLADGTVHLSASGVEVEHARSLLHELDSMRTQLLTFIANQEQGRRARVVRFPR